MQWDEVRDARILVLAVCILFRAARSLHNIRVRDIIAPHQYLLYSTVQYQLNLEETKTCIDHQTAIAAAAALPLLARTPPSQSIPVHRLLVGGER